MKIKELFTEAKVDYSANVAALEQTPEFKKFSEKFELKSTPAQRKNGTLEIFSKPHLHKEARVFNVNPKGVIKVRNEYASMAAKVEQLHGVEGSVDLMLRAIQVIEREYDDWFTRRARLGQKNGNDVSNLGLKTLEGHDLPEKVKKDFNCSQNDLKSLKGAPEIPSSANFYASSNELISPLEGAPEQCGVFSVQNNKLTTCEGFPRHVDWAHMGSNQFTSYKGIEKCFDFCRGFSITANHNGTPIGLLSFFKVKGCDHISPGPGNSEEDKKAIAIISRGLTNKKSILHCQEELIDAGLEGYAQF